MRATARWAATLAIGASAAGCSALFPAPAPAAAGADAALVADAALQDVPTDAAAQTPDADTTPPDAAADADVCSCPTGQVRKVGACVPTFDLGCGLPCIGKAPSACPSQSICDEAAAELPCQPDVPAAACVPASAMQFTPGSLRVEPDSVSVGETVTLTVRGARFSIGALMWWLRVGDATLQAIEYESDCTLTASYSPNDAGLFPVLAFYGGGEEPPPPAAALAGFVRVGEGPPPLAQPGESCVADADCQSGGPFECVCASGRCGCSSAP
ncbi:MAG: hypothetical protein RIT45_4179 [Pseudomonadota bacterium]|jgi:hypothetical protein